MRKSDEEKLEAKEREWDESRSAMDKFIDKTRVNMKKITRDTKYNITNWLDLYFHDSDLRGMSKTLHRIGVLCVDVIILRLLRLI